MRRRTKCLLSFFFVFHIGVALYVNRPPYLAEPMARWQQKHLSSETQHTLAMADWRTKHYAYWLGVDNRWEMFSTLHRFDWILEMRAWMPNGEWKLLETPRYGHRTFFEKNFIDFREAKLQLNLYPYAEYRTAYARYLCRHIPGARAISIDLAFHEYLPRAAAQSAGQHFLRQPQTQPFDRVSCS